MGLKRFISAMAGLAIFFSLIFLDRLVIATALFIIACAACAEYLRAMKKAGHKTFDIFSYLSLLLIPYTVWALEKNVPTATVFKVIAGVSLLLFISLMSAYLVANTRHTIPDLFATLFSMAYIAPLFSALIATRYSEHGIYHVFIAFGGAWITDTFAYFTGKLFGKKKLIPAISPNKTVAGAVGGLVGTTIVTIIYGLILNRYIYGSDISIFAFILLGLMLASFSQFGDLIASAIKRYSGIKDFGSIMPGHGGAIDRFDSVMFTAAVTLVYTMIFF